MKTKATSLRVLYVDDNPQMRQALARSLSAWHLAAVSCLPVPNPQGRFREQEILCQVDVDTVDYAKEASNGRRFGRWDERRNAATQLRG